MFKYVKTCGDCEYNDGLCYTTYPAQYRCTITGKLNFGDHECNLDFTPVIRCENCFYSSDKCTEYEVPLHMSEDEVWCKHNKRICGKDDFCSDAFLREVE